MRQGVVHFIEQLQSLKKQGLKRISMTTNGHYLKQYAAALKQAGLDDLNISLDSLDAEQFQHLTKNNYIQCWKAFRPHNRLVLTSKSIPC
jgi:cyclic pyranopterin phosphate synthase